MDRTPYYAPALYASKGCEQCNGLGYRGRIGVFEFLTGGPKFEELILTQASEVALRGLTAEQGMVSMQSDGILKSILGVTTLAEVARATGPIPWWSETETKTPAKEPELEVKRSKKK